MTDYSLIADLIIFDIASTMIIPLSFLPAFHLIPLTHSKLNKLKAKQYKVCLVTTSYWVWGKIGCDSISLQCQKLREW